MSLARQFPRQILGIFIRDVTTPLPPKLSKAASASRESVISLTNLHKRLEPKRRDSEIVQEKLLESMTKVDGKSSLMSTSALKKALPKEKDDEVEELDDADDFSPNNPLDRNASESGNLAPLDHEGFTEMEQRINALFRERLFRAQKDVPKGVLLKVFRGGGECIEDAKRLMARAH